MKKPIEFGWLPLDLISVVFIKVQAAHLKMVPNLDCHVEAHTQQDHDSSTDW